MACQYSAIFPLPVVTTVRPPGTGLYVT